MHLPPPPPPLCPCNNKSCAFVQYTYRANAEFAKEAMSNQALLASEEIASSRGILCMHCCIYLLEDMISSVYRYAYLCIVTRDIYMVLRVFPLVAAVLAAGHLEAAFELLKTHGM